MEYLWKCPTCDSEVRVDRKMADSGVGPTNKEKTCKHRPAYERVYETPGITKASFLDGTKRKGFADIKEVARLEVKKANANSESERREAQASINAIRKS